MIPKIIHQLWVGPLPLPEEWMRTWREKNPDWKYMLWDNEKVFGRKWRNQKHIDFYKAKQNWPGVADLVRYEILYENGGFYPGADSICLEPIDELFEDGFDIYSVYENEIKRPGYVSPIHAATPGHPFLEQIISELHQKEVMGKPWQTTGNLYMMEAINRLKPIIKIWPSYTLIPEHFTGQKYEGTGKVYARHLFGTTKKLYAK